MTPLSEEQIWEVLDGTASAELLTQHQLLLATDDRYRQQFNTCEQLHNCLLALPLESPSMRFTENVMDRISMPPVLAKALDKTPYIFLAAMAAVVSVILIFLPKMDVEPTNLPILTTLTEGVVAELSNPILYYGFMLINVALFFIFIDRQLFKPYFERRAKG